MVSRMNDEQVAKLDSFLKQSEDEILDSTLLFLRYKLEQVVAQMPDARKRIQELSAKMQVAQSDLAKLLNIENYLANCIVEKLENNELDEKQKG